MAILGLSHIDLPVSDLERSLRLFTGPLGFWEKGRGDGYVDVDTGTCVVRLVATRRVEHPVSLRIQVNDVEAAVATLAASGLRLLYPPTRTPAQELLAQLADADGHGLIIWRELSEDEYEKIPELPKELSWRPDAEALLQSLLRSVPALFRGLARRRVSKNAEYLAEATRVVTKEEVIRSFILSSAKVTRYRVRKPLVEHGIDLERYAADFAAEERL